MAAAGCLEENQNPERTLALGTLFGWKVIKVLQAQPLGNLPRHCRVGLHQGGLTCGVIGKQCLQYDLWGETVRTCACKDVAVK